MFNMAQVQRRMLPIGPLMNEHRLIEHMIRLMKVEMDRIGTYGRADVDFMDSVVSFMKAFADVSHHGKEENILFGELYVKPMPDGLKSLMDDLIEEHVLMRKLTNDLVRAMENYVQGKPEAKAEIIMSLNSLIELYPGHIEKEDKHFFMPAMSYLSAEEKDEMLCAFGEFDSALFHDEYKSMIDDMEERWHTPAEITSK